MKGFGTTGRQPTRQNQLNDWSTNLSTNHPNLKTCFRKQIIGMQVKILFSQNTFVEESSNFIHYQISRIFVINQVKSVSSCWGRRRTPVVCNEKGEPYTSHNPNRPVEIIERERKDFILFRDYQTFLTNTSAVFANITRTTN